jgi:selenocysteine lyase/cysteine desulfurase
LNTAFKRIRSHEKKLSERLLAYLTSTEAAEAGVRVIGPSATEERAPTISFVVVKSGDGGVWDKSVLSKDVVSAVQEGGDVSVPHR